MKVLRNLPAAKKILMSLAPIEPIKHRIEEAKRTGDLEAEKAAVLDASYTWGTYLVEQFHATIEVEGRENLPKPGGGPVVYVCNHQSYADVPALCHVLNTVQFGFMAKDNLKQIPIYGRWMKRVRSVMIKREDARASLRAIAEGVGFIEEGSSMLVFPEGTRSWGGPMHPFKAGSLKLATKPRVPIIPISLNGTYKIFEESGYFKNGQTVKMIIHPPIPTEGLDRKQEKALNAKVEAIVSEGVARLREEMGMPEHTEEEVAAMKKRVDLDKVEEQAIRQAEKEEARREKEAVKAELKAAREKMKADTRAVKEEASAKVKEAKEQARAIERETKEAREEANAKVKAAKEEANAKVKAAKEEAKEQVNARVNEAREAADLHISAAVLNAKEQTYEDPGLLDSLGETAYDPDDREAESAEAIVDTEE